MKRFIKGLIFAFVLILPFSTWADQEDYNIANQNFPSFRADLNNNLGAAATNNSGATEPTTTFPYMWWADTTTGILKQRNAANSAFIPIGTLAENNLGLLPLDGATLTGRLGFKEGTPVASSATTAISIVDGNIVHITGTTNISAFTMITGQIQDIIFDSALDLIFNATTNKTLTGATVPTTAGDMARYYYDGTVVRMMDYVRIDGTALFVDLSSPGDIGNTTPATSLAVDNITVNGNLIATVTGDLELKAVAGSELTFQDDADATKEVIIDLGGATTITKTTVAMVQTVDRTVTLPDATDTLMGKATTDVLTNKTFDANGTGNVLSNIDIGNSIAASQVEAETGTDNTKLVTPLRVAQAIAALGGGGAATNFIIDGDFTQWPEFTVATIPTNNAYTSAMIKDEHSHDGAHTVERSTDVPTIVESDHQSAYSYLIKCTGTDVSLAASQRLLLKSIITGSDFGSLHQQEITVSFWAKTAVANSGDTYGLSYTNNAVDRSLVHDFTPTSSWAKFTHTLTLDTSGTWLFTEADIGLQLRFGLASGSSFIGTSDTWTGSNLIATSSTSNFMDNTSNELYIAQLQLVIGSTAPTLTLLPIAVIKEQVDYYVQRYDYSNISSELVMTAFVESTSGMSGNFIYRNKLRVAPTITHSAASTFQGYDSAAIAQLNAVSSIGIGINTAHFVVTQAGTTWTTSNPGRLRRNGTNTTWIMLDSRH